MTEVPTVSATPLIVPSSPDISNQAGQPATACVYVRLAGFKSISS